jgi:uncharacterized protein (DUF1015 family)
MADVRAFRGYRYDLGKVGSLSDVVCPPYDVIDGGLQKELYAKSPFNAVRVELTTDEPGDTDANNKYNRAANAFREWQLENALVQDTARSLYVYEQEFTVDGTPFVRRGFLARVRLEPFGTGRIFPHEQTLSGPKADRLKLYHATGFNVSPIFGLYPDEANEVAAALAPAVAGSPPRVATDHLGVVHRLWVVTDQQVISKVVGLLGPKPVYLADGHHRYETGLKYLDERRAAGEVPDDEAPPNFCLMMLVGMSDPGLVILPTHRLVSGLPAVTTEQFRTAVRDHFEIVSTAPDAAACWQDVELDGSQTVLGFGTVADGKWVVARLKDPAEMARLAPDHSAAWRGLAVSVLHRLVLDRLLPAKFGSPANCRYVHTVKEVTDAVTAKGCQLACLVPPATMAHVETIAGHRETMPAKSTYFYPKVLTGMVFNSLKKD